MSNCLKCGKKRSQTEELLNCPYCYECATEHDREKSEKDE